MTKEEIKHSSKNGKMSQTQIIKININTEKKAKRKQTPKPKKENKEPLLTPEEKAYVNAYGDTGQDNKLIKPPLRHSTGFNDTQSFNPIVIPTITDAQMTQLNTQINSNQLALPPPSNPNIYLRNEPMDLQPLYDFMHKQLTYTNMPSGKYSDRFEEIDEEFETTPPTSPTVAPAAAPASPTAFPNPITAIAGMLSPTAAASAPTPAPALAPATAQKRGKPLQPRENLSRRSLYLRIKRLLNSEVLTDNKLKIAQEDYQYFVQQWKPDEYYINELKGLFPDRVRSSL